ncbi:MAG: BirA family transcriptional regulator [Frankiaceae bacterium]|nr:BirA family transcriptional regulator [Frankiaceae bacterium]
MSSYADLGRPPLDGRRITQALQRTSELWREVHVVARTGSTNTDLVARAAAGEGEGLVLAAEEQDAGRGRLDRVWTAPPRSALTFSVLLRPPLPPSTRPLLPLLAGLAIVDALAGRYGVEAALKWPNDVLARDRKLAGVLAETVDDAVVVGIGLNVLQRVGELPVDTAVALVALTAEPVDRSIVLLAVLRAFEARYGAWLEADGAAPDLLASYRAHCSTIGRDVRVELAGETLHGRAVDVDTNGHLVVETGGGVRHIAAGDVIHVRRE